MTEVYTYPEMNKTVKELLRNSDEPMLMYAAARIEELEKALPLWIPTADFLPEYKGFYLVAVGAPYKPIRIAEYNPTKWRDEDENLWMIDGNYCYNWFVEYWMPLPKLPERAENDGR